MKSTASLLIISDYNMAQDIVVIHPNDGYDLGLISYSYPIKIFINTPMDDFKQENTMSKDNNDYINYINGNIILKNECKANTVEISHKICQKIKNPKKLKLFYINNKLLLMPDKDSAAK